MKILTDKDYIKQDFDWGKLTWYASDEIGGTSDMTFGKCSIKPGKSNPRHHHPNCEEIMHLMEGSVIHTMDDREYEIQKGETIIVPENVVHNAINIGEDDAVMLIVFSTSKRKMVKENHAHN